MSGTSGAISKKTSTSAMEAVDSKTEESLIRIEEVRVRNFRSLKNINIKLDALTVLVGENNSGKTSFLDALMVAIGVSRHNITEEDIFLAPEEKRCPKERKVTIDILIHPIDKNGKVLDRFPEESNWLFTWHGGISYDNEDNEFVGIRTLVYWDKDKGDYVIEKGFLKDWQSNPDNLELSTTKGTVTFQQIEPIALYYMDAKRDLQDELRNKGSFWNKLVSDIGVEESEVKPIEEMLDDINRKIIASSEKLAHIHTHLNNIEQTISCGKGSISITALPPNLRDLKNSMDVNFSTAGAQSFPLTRHGMGTRCLAALMVFQAYTTWRQKKMGDNSLHSMLALEEPEAHLHPQAQRALFKQITGIPGQRIVSTHSPYIAGQANILEFRHFKKRGAETIIKQLNVANLETDDVNKINRRVMNTRGEILFARALILFEGETEEIALPIYAKQYWGIDSQALGISFVSVGGYGGYVPFLKLADSFDIPWYIFSDGEKDVIERRDRSLARLNLSDTTNKIFTLPDNNKYETYIVNDDYIDIIVDAVSIEIANEKNSRPDYVKKAILKNKDVKAEILRILMANKTRYASAVATAIVEKSNSDKKVPPLINELFEQLSSDLNI